MTTVEELNEKALSLQAELQNIEAEKVAAKQREYEGKLNLITVLEKEAQGFREQAKIATSENDKRTLFGFAAENDRQANEVRKELGIQVAEETTELEDYTYNAKQQVLRGINSLLIKAGISLAGFFLMDIVSSIMDGGTLAAMSKQLSQVLFHVASTLGSVWLTCMILFQFVGGYTIHEISDDFKGLTPVQKIATLVALFGIILHLLNSANQG